MTAFEFNSRILDLNDFIARFALQYTKDQELAKDLTQETILKALSNREKFKTNTNLKGWLKVILKNTFINSYRKKSNQMISYNSDYYRVMNGDPHEYKPDDIMMKDHIEELIDELDSSLSTPFRMHYEGYKYHEIADELNLALGTVKSRIHQSRKILSKRIER